MRRSIKQGALENARRAAEAARLLDPEDVHVLMLAHMGRDSDQATIDRLLQDPLAEAYAKSTLARWRGEKVAEGHDTTGGYR